MNRHANLVRIWKKLMAILVIVCGIACLVNSFAGPYKVTFLVFAFGNIGGYVGIHRSLSVASDDQIQDMASTWLALVVPSFISGILAFVLYILFLSNIVSGDMFPKFVPDKTMIDIVGFDSLSSQHAEKLSDYGKLLFWSFIAGFNQKYVVDMIDSLKPRA